MQPEITVLNARKKVRLKRVSRSDKDNSNLASLIYDINFVKINTSFCAFWKSSLACSVPWQRADSLQKANSINLLLLHAIAMGNPLEAL